MNLYISIQILLVLLTFVLLYCLVRTLKYAFIKLGFSKNKQKQLLYFISFGLTCWLGILAVLSLLGVFEDFATIPPKILVAVFPSIVLIGGLLISKPFFKILAQIPPAWLIYIQSFRFILELILWLGLVAGIVPFQMTIEGFNYDIVVGITAIMAGFVFFGKGRFRHFEAFIWNLFGIILLINIVFISVISTPSPFRIFFNEPANTIIAYFPFIWIPGFFVPFALAMHLFSIKQIWYHKKLNLE